jgi:ABC-type multidrug transport system ATPase subunit
VLTKLFSSTVLMKALVNRLRPAPGARIEGDVFYQGDSIHSGKFIPAKIAGYVEQGDTHDAVLTVEETLRFAWTATTGGHHSYALAKVWK